MSELTYELRKDGVCYTVSDDIRVLVQGKGIRHATVFLQKGEDVVPPETGNLGGSKFRDKLTDLAKERFGDVNGFAGELGHISMMFNEHLKERQEAAADHKEKADVPEFSDTPYLILGGGFSRIRYTGDQEIAVPLTNFIARVEEEVLRDDGAEERRIYKIAGRIGDRHLPKIDVPVSQFPSMNWVSEYWGLEAHITAGQHVYAREAIELYSRGAIKKLRFAHTGWRVLPDGKRVFLHSKGAIA